MLKIESIDAITALFLFEREIELFKIVLGFKAKAASPSAVQQKNACMLKLLLTKELTKL